MDQCQVCHDEDVFVMRAGDVLRRYTVEKAPLEDWVKMCGSCAEMIEGVYGKEEEEEEDSSGILSTSIKYEELLAS